MASQRALFERFRDQVAASSYGEAGHPEAAHAGTAEPALR